LKSSLFWESPSPSKTLRIRTSQGMVMFEPKRELFSNLRARVSAAKLSGVFGVYCSSLFHSRDSLFRYDSKNEGLRICPLHTYSWRVRVFCAVNGPFSATPVWQVDCIDLNNLFLRQPLMQSCRADPNQTISRIDTPLSVFPTKIPMPSATRQLPALRH
jgi:hypothetical protein